MRKVAVLADAPPPRTQQQFVRQARKLVGIGLLDAPQVFVANGRTALELHGLRQHEHDVARQRQSLVVLRVSADTGFGKVAALGEAAGERLAGQHGFGGGVGLRLLLLLLLLLCHGGGYGRRQRGFGGSVAFVGSGRGDATRLRVRVLVVFVVLGFVGTFVGGASSAFASTAAASVMTAAPTIVMVTMVI